VSAIDPVGSGVTAQLVSVALDAALARHAALATNIANAETPGYQPLAARFDQLVEQLQGRVGDRSLDATTERAVRSMRESLDSQPLTADPHATKVELDMQMAGLSRNSLQYQALLTAQSKLMAMEQLVIGEGKM
jgi:flagellar basal-body rod protein FlgB